MPNAERKGPAGGSFPLDIVGPMQHALLADLEPLAFLLGIWRGAGAGGYPTSDSFEFEEETRFWHVGLNHVLYQQRTWVPGDESDAIHMELGFLRPAGPGRVEFLLAYPLGSVDVEEGTVTDGVLELTSTGVARAATGDPVQGFFRRIEVDGDTLSYELRMATDSVPLTRHATATLRRV